MMTAPMSSASSPICAVNHSNFSTTATQFVVLSSFHMASSISSMRGMTWMFSAFFTPDDTK